MTVIIIAAAESAAKPSVGRKGNTLPSRPTSQMRKPKMEVVSFQTALKMPSTMSFSRSASHLKGLMPEPPPELSEPPGVGVGEGLSGSGVEPPGSGDGDGVGVGVGVDSGALIVI